MSQALKKTGDLGWKPLVYISHVSAQMHPAPALVGLENTAGMMTASIVNDPSDPSWPKPTRRGQPAASSARSAEHEST